MNCKLISSCEPQLCLNQNRNQIKTATKDLGFSPSISFCPKLEVPKLHAKVSCRGNKVKAMATSSTLQDICNTTESFYDLLGVSKNGTVSDMKKAYKQLARKYHPDVSPEDCVEEYTRRFIMAKEAYDTLSDPQKRAIYDRDLAKRSSYSYPFAFSARKETQFDQKFDDIGEWTNRWKSQVEEMGRKSMNNRGKTSCGARMRRQ